MQRGMRKIWEVMDTYTILKVVKVSGGIHISKHQFIHTKYMHVNFISIKQNKKPKYNKYVKSICREISKEINGKKSIWKMFPHCLCISCFHYKGREKGMQCNICSMPHSTPLTLANCIKIHALGCEGGGGSAQNHQFP